MNALALKLYVKVQNLLAAEEGQDLVEYALLVSLVALGCITAVGSVASAVTSVFGNVSTSI